MGSGKNRPVNTEFVTDVDSTRDSTIIDTPSTHEGDVVVYNGFNLDMSTNKGVVNPSGDLLPQRVPDIISARFPTMAKTPFSVQTATTVSPPSTQLPLPKPLAQPYSQPHFPFGPDLTREHRHCTLPDGCSEDSQAWTSPSYSTGQQVMPFSNVFVIFISVSTRER
jgi:hypothetical protein